MLKALVHFSLKFRVVVIVLAGVLIACGIYTTQNAQLDVFPDFVQPQVAIQTEAPGFSPEQVESLITRPIEAAVNGLSDMESLRSESIEGLSIITAVFKDGSDVFRARQMLSEILSSTISALPAGAKPPRMTPLTSSTMDLLKIGLTSEKLSPMELRSFADWTLKPRLLSVAGVAKCSSYGGDVRQLQIQVLPEKLLAYDLALADVVATARSSTAIMGAGFIETANQRITIQTEGQALTPEALGAVIVRYTNGISVRLKDVAHVVEGAEPKFGDALVMGKPGVLLTMSSQYGANTMQVTRALEKALEEMKPVLKEHEIMLYPSLHRPASFIENALHNMEHSLLLGGILVAVILFVLLGSVRTACISLVAIPMSLLTAVIVLQQFGVTLNTITLGGLVIALGEVVDDSIIDVENIFRRLRENKTLAQPRPVFQVVLDASLEVRSSVVFATFVVALVFLPVLTMTGLQGKFFAPLAVSYILAIMASLLVALTITPALTYLLFGKGARKSDAPWIQQWLKRIYSRLLELIIAWPRTVILIVALVCVAALTRLPFFGSEFLPEFREGHLVVHVFAAPGTSLPEMRRIGSNLSAELLKNEHIATVAQQIGRAELGEDPWGQNRSEFHVELKSISGEEQEKTTEEVRQILEKFPGIQFEVLTFLGDRVGETLTGETAPVVINIFGEDLDVLDDKAREVAGVLKKISGQADVKVKSPPGAPRIVVRLQPQKMAQFGLRPVEVLDAVQTSYQGVIAAQTQRDNQRVDVAVILDDVRRQDPEGIGNLLLRTAQGALLPLWQVADVYPTSGPFSILHEGARRRQTVTCATSGRAISAFVAEAKEQIAAKVKLPANTYLEFSGAAEASVKARNELLLHSAVAGVGILLLLMVAFGNWRNLLLVLVNVPFALVGGVLAIWLTNVFSDEASALTLGSLVGFVTLFGITTRNSIMMISHFEYLVAVEGMTWGREAALRGAAERLVPILMTAIVTAFGLLPLALGSGEAGREIEGPMAVVILGGLVTSTLLNLLVLPSLALRFGRFAPATLANPTEIPAKRA